MSEVNSGNLNARWVGGAAQKVEGGENEKDGRVFVYLTADWRDATLKPPPFKLSKRETLPIHVSCLGPEHWLLQCTAVIVLRGNQCGPIHLNIVGHIREWLWSITDPQTTRRMVEGSGMADYLNMIWCAPSHHKLYREATREHGFYEYEWGVDGESWDAFWYIYRRHYPTPSYAHIGLDKSASLNSQKHVADEVKAMIRHAYEEAREHPLGSDRNKKGFFSKLF
mmetsp:Transcript_6051/g.18602  ORF Transcript_6051/g.18602 Transcript_6051/m.18602 type:complete len:224 (+) Transcript_6051:50-721(+)